MKKLLIILSVLFFISVVPAGARTFSWGEVENFDDQSAINDGDQQLVSPEICYSNQMATTQWMSSNGWDGGAFLRFNIQVSPAGWEDDGGCTEIYYPSPTDTVYISWIQRVGSTYRHAINHEEHKFIMAYSEGAAPDRPTLFDWHVNNGGSMAYAVYAIANDANGAGLQDELASSNPSAGYPDHTFKMGPSDGQGWTFHVVKIDVGGNNVHYVWDRDGTNGILDGDALSTTPNTGTTQLNLYARIFAYHKGSDEGDGVDSNSYFDLDNIGVDNSMPSPPAGFVTGTVKKSISVGGVPITVGGKRLKLE